MMYLTRLLIALMAIQAMDAPSRAADSHDPTDPPCAPRRDIVQFLYKSFGERVVARGLSSTGAVLEVYVATTGTWTIVATEPTGISCLLIGGFAWEDAAPPVSSI